ncbi:MAG: hypothetical protein N0C88_08590 [Candidatus Thiodiazotropha lotti]|uniref:Uncharacterized protein n=1 Tax=Candidatus Thiodiazotropha lotti TaxID=2792787 RepID=A0A9E4K5K2_9GAMM|nr:hypothetical protein [Candidatus Thiodiazotropha lotti]MCW4203366.1 hypothetical protein [Candidatus Thiodiazotropha lotti]
MHDDFDDNPDLEERLKCDVKIDCSNSKAVAWVLRSLADQIEQENLDTGFHDVKVPNGDKVGEVYLDYYAQSI